MIRYGVLLLSVLGLSAQSVTFDVAQYRDERNAPVLVFSGTISSRAGGEYVEVLGRECGSKGPRLISGTQTTGGGGWRVENPDSRTYPPRLTPVYSGMTFRARWKGEYSRPATPTGQEGFQGKLVELQRQSGGSWVRVRSARLARRVNLRWGVFNYQASFRIPARGLTLRAHLPAKSAAPCFLPGSSPTWMS